MSVKTNIDERFIDSIAELTKTDFLNEVCENAVANEKEQIPDASGNLKNKTNFINDNGVVEFYSNTAYASKIDEKYHFTDEIINYDFENHLSKILKGVLKWI